MENRRASDVLAIQIPNKISNTSTTQQRVFCQSHLTNVDEAPGNSRLAFEISETENYP